MTTISSGPVVVSRYLILFSLSIHFPKLFQTFCFPQLGLPKSLFSTDKACFFLEMISNQKTIHPHLPTTKTNLSASVTHIHCFLFYHSGSSVSTILETNPSTCVLDFHPPEICKNIYPAFNTSSSIIFNFFCFTRWFPSAYKISLILKNKPWPCFLSNFYPFLS